MEDINIALLIDSDNISARYIAGILRELSKYGKMPLDIQLGVTKKLTGAPFRLSATLVDLNHLDQKFINHLVAGVDIIISPQFEPMHQLIISFQFLCISFNSFR